MIDINLMPPADVVSKDEKSLRSRITSVFTIFSVIVIVISVGIIGINIFFLAQLNSQTQKKTQFIDSFNSQIQTAQDLASLKYKVTGIKIVQTSRTDFATMAADLNLSLGGTVPKNIIIDSDRNIEVGASTGDLATLSKFINTVSAQGQPFSKAILSGLALTPTGYTFTLKTQYDISGH